MTRDECIALIDQSSWRSLACVIGMLQAQADNAGRRCVAAMGMVFVARLRARPSSLHHETDQVLEELSQAKGAIDAAARGASSVTEVTTRLLSVARNVVRDAAVASVEWATTADVAEALLAEASHCADSAAARGPLSRSTMQRLADPMPHSRGHEGARSTAGILSTLPTFPIGVEASAWGIAPTAHRSPAGAPVRWGPCHIKPTTHGNVEPVPHATPGSPRPSCA